MIGSRTATSSQKSSRVSYAARIFSSLMTCSTCKLQGNFSCMREECHRKEAKNLDHSFMRSGIWDPKDLKFSNLHGWTDSPPWCCHAKKKKSINKPESTYSYAGTRLLSRSKKLRNFLAQLLHLNLTLVAEQLDACHCKPQQCLAVASIPHTKNKMARLPIRHK